MTTPSIVVVDDFYPDPFAIRRACLHGTETADPVALELHPERHKGRRGPEMPIGGDLRRALESITGARVGRGYWCFQVCVAGDQTVFHSDQQRWAAVVHLTPHAPPSAGTRFYRSRESGVRSSAELTMSGDAKMNRRVMNASPEYLERLTYANKLLDPCAWELVDQVGAVWNRLVVWDGRLIHAAGDYFGHDEYTGRLFQILFWDPAPGETSDMQCGSDAQSPP